MPYDPSAFPYSAVCYITDSLARGSGVLISPDCVLTASHVVYRSDIGAVAASSIQVSPGYNNGPSSIGTLGVSAYNYFKITNNGGIISTTETQSDFAVLHLIGSAAGAGTMGILPDFSGGTVNVTGYPNGSGQAQTNASEVATKVANLTELSYDALLGPGSSGGPLWTGSAANPKVVGIVSSVIGSTDRAGLITSPVYQQIYAWVAAFDGLPSPTTGVNTIKITGAEAFGYSSPDATIGMPFTTILVTDSGVPRPTVTITVTSDGFLDTAKGSPGNIRYHIPGKVTFVDPNKETDSSTIDPKTGAFTVSGTDAQVTAILRALQASIPLPGAISNATFSITATDGTGAKATDTSTTYDFNAPINPNSVFRFFDTTFGTHFFTASSAERDTIKGTRLDLVQETNGFGTAASGSPSTEMVYRFFDIIHGTHFFTASQAEHDAILQTRPDLTAEPSAFFLEHATQQTGDVAVYRFFDTKLGTHFYTGDNAEYKGIITAGSNSFRADLTYEGVGFYAPAGTYT